MVSRGLFPSDFEPMNGFEYVEGSPSRPTFESVDPQSQTRSGSVLDCRTSVLVTLIPTGLFEKRHNYELDGDLSLLQLPSFYVKSPTTFPYPSKVFLISDE